VPPPDTHPGPDFLPGSMSPVRAHMASAVTVLSAFIISLPAHAVVARAAVPAVIGAAHGMEADESQGDCQRALANTFFLNLRTLSSKPNISFILVGAEKMPHVMSSQGERLNKFARESLDSFDLSSEWADYRELVQTPVAHSIKVHEAAVRKLFELTDGHPYFTKVLCGAMYNMDLPRSLKKGFSAIYGWTSGPDGIRHALMEGARAPGEAEARLMLVICSAYVNYLLSLPGSDSA